MTRARLLAEASSREIAEWMAFYALEAEGEPEREPTEEELIAKLDKWAAASSARPR